MQELKNIEGNLNIFSSNIKSLISIFKDSDVIREKRANELENILESKSWSESEFNRYSHYTFHFDWLLLQSLFASGFTYFESYLMGVAKAIELMSNSRITLNDIKGNGYLDTYRKYIHLIGSIDAANSDRKEWQTILEFKFIRNAIIHKQGLIDKTNSKIEEYDLYYGPSKKLIRIKTVGFLEDFADHSIDYMNAIYDELAK